jgi:hypothetical protein
MRSKGPWLNVFALLCLLTWTAGWFSLNRSMPPIYPTRELICANFADPADIPRQPPHIPEQIGPLAMLGVPYWGTWMPAYVPPNPTPPDPYPACVRNDASLLAAEVRFWRAWSTWYQRESGSVLLWLFSPLASLPILLIAAKLTAQAKPPKPPQSNRNRPGGGAVATAPRRTALPTATAPPHSGLRARLSPAARKV